MHRRVLRIHQAPMVNARADLVVLVLALNRLRDDTELLALHLPTFHQLIEVPGGMCANEATYRLPVALQSVLSDEGA